MNRLHNILFVLLFLPTTAIAQVDTTSHILQSTPNQTDTIHPKHNYRSKYADRNPGIPQHPSFVGDNQYVIHKLFSLSYNNTHEQADWVFYLITREMTHGTATRANDRFKSDPYVREYTAEPWDYSQSGYDRGHLCPSGDMSIDDFAQAETFYMSNISPQNRAFNRGIWKSLEDKVRKWANIHDSIYVVTGPVLKTGLPQIGNQTMISIPEQYYKIVYSNRKGGQMIAFLIPNDACKGHRFTDYIVTVDEIETITGIDFFPGLNKEAELESKIGNLNWWH